MVKHLNMPLLRLPAIKALGLLICVDSIDTGTLKSSYPKLCSGLGMLQQLYNIKLKSGAVLFCKKPQEDSTTAGARSQSVGLHDEINSIIAVVGLCSLYEQG